MKKLVFRLGCLAILSFAFLGNMKDSHATIDVASAYQMVCALCHGANGDGSTQGKKFNVPDLTDKKWQESVTDEQMIKKMIDGAPDNPGYSQGIVPLLDMLGVDNPKDEVASFVPMIRGFAK